MTKLAKPFALALCLGASSLALSSASAQSPSNGAVVDTYVAIANAAYADALTTARDLQAAVNALIANPNDDTLDAARQAWIAARAPYQQTEAFRFGNPIVDEWEGRVNAWPLDEGLIDYVDASYGEISDLNGLYTANVIANTTLVINGQATDIPVITPEVIATVLHEAGQVEANVASGYHAIEFLLWGQDLNGTESGAGNRPATDFDTANCTNGNCDRRIQYLEAAVQLLITDLEEMVANWQSAGAATANLKRDEAAAVAAMLTGMGSLSYGELAGERTKLGLLLHDPEEEHDCFSDNTHASHFYDIQGIANVYRGSYTGVDGAEVSGVSLSDLVAAKDPALDAEMQAKLDASIAAAAKLVARAAAGEAYDQMIAEGNEDGNAAVQAVVDALIDQTATIERIVALLDVAGVEIEGSDSLTDANSVFQ